MAARDDFRRLAELPDPDPHTHPHGVPRPPRQLTVSPSSLQHPDKTPPYPVTVTISQSIPVTSSGHTASVTSLATYEDDSCLSPLHLPPGSANRDSGYNTEVSPANMATPPRSDIFRFPDFVELEERKNRPTLHNNEPCCTPSSKLKEIPVSRLRRKSLLERRNEKSNLPVLPPLSPVSPIIPSNTLTSTRQNVGNNDTDQCKKLENDGVFDSGHQSVSSDGDTSDQHCKALSSAGRMRASTFNIDSSGNVITVTSSSSGNDDDEGEVFYPGVWTGGQGRRARSQSFSLRTRWETSRYVEDDDDSEEEGIRYISTRKSDNACLYKDDHKEYDHNPDRARTGSIGNLLLSGDNSGEATATGPASPSLNESSFLCSSQSFEASQAQNDNHTRRDSDHNMFRFDSDDEEFLPRSPMRRRANTTVDISQLSNNINPAERYIYMEPAHQNQSRLPAHDIRAGASLSVNPHPQVSIAFERLRHNQESYNASTPSQVFHERSSPSRINNGHFLGNHGFSDYPQGRSNQPAILHERPPSSPVSRRVTSPVTLPGGLRLVGMRGTVSIATQTPHQASVLIRQVLETPVTLPNETRGTVVSRLRRQSEGDSPPPLPDLVPLGRDRSLSAPDIRHLARVAGRQVGRELRQLSDQFNMELRRLPAVREESQYPASYPETSYLRVTRFVSSVIRGTFGRARSSSVDMTDQ